MAREMCNVRRRSDLDTKSVGDASKPGYSQRSQFLRIYPWSVARAIDMQLLHSRGAACSFVKSHSAQPASLR